MNKKIKLLLFISAVVVNVIFFLACGYGKVIQPDTAFYLDPILGVIGIAALAFGEVRLLIQIYYRTKYQHLRCRTFDFRFWRHCIVFALYYIGSLLYLSAAYYDFSSGYLSIFALALCPLWLTGTSRTLWYGGSGEESYYLDDSCKWYLVKNVMENDDVVEITCTAPGDRERVITIAKKKQKLDQ